MNDTNEGEKSLNLTKEKVSPVDVLTETEKKRKTVSTQNCEQPKTWNESWVELERIGVFDESQKLDSERDFFAESWAELARIVAEGQ